MAPKAGDALPDVTLYEGAGPATPVKLRELFAGKKGILFGVPGAFTAGCSKTHLPGYVKDYEKLKEAGAEVIACVSVNDPFVMAAWGAEHKTDGKVHMLADKDMKLTEALDIIKDLTELLGSKRCQRFSAVVEDNVFKTFNLDDGLTCSLSNVIIEQL